MIDTVVIQQTEEQYAPPELPVLQVAMVQDDTFLTIGHYSETHDTSMLWTIATVEVPTRDLLAALTALKEGRQS